MPVRPTTDFAKTGLFNILENRYNINQMNCLDLYAGTGSISFELISRGAVQVTSVDRDAGCVNFIRSTANKMNIDNLIAVKSDTFKYLESCRSKFDLIFADPPFEYESRSDLHQLIFSINLLNPDGLLVIEHVSSEKLDQLAGFESSRTYGNVTFSFFHNFDN